MYTSRTIVVESSSPSINSPETADTNIYPENHSYSGFPHPDLAVHVYPQPSPYSSKPGSTAVSPTHGTVAPLSAKSLFLGKNYGAHSPNSDRHNNINENVSEHVTRSKPVAAAAAVATTTTSRTELQEEKEDSLPINSHKQKSEEDIMSNASGYYYPQQQRTTSWVSYFFHNKSKQTSVNSLDSSSNSNTRSWFIDFVSMFNVRSRQSPSARKYSTQTATTTTTSLQQQSTSSADNSQADISSSSNVPCCELNPQCDEYYLKSYFFNLFKTFRTPELHVEYSEFCVQQRSMVVVLGYAIFFFSSFLLAGLAPISIQREHIHYSAIVTLSVISTCLNFIDSILAFVIVYRQTRHCAKSMAWLPRTIKRYAADIQSVLFLTATIAYCARMMARTIGGECNVEDIDRFKYLAIWNCNPYHPINALPMDTAMAMMFTPIAYPAIFRECRMDVSVICFALVIITFIIGCIVIENIQPLYFLCMYTFLCVFIAMESPRQNLISFVAHKKFQVASLENEKMAAQTEVEMRHVLGNVAHDFKTPLSSFMNGIDLIGHTMDDFEIMMCHHKESIQNSPETTLGSSDCINSSLTLHKESQSFMKSMRMMLHDVRSTNSFMLMTINRCLDFTKVSKGMKLTPKYETFDLIETIAMPINCMKNIQNRVSVSLTDISGLICSHIITDKQWLQENILCLLSNAVKYSSDGEVTISISLQKYRNGNVPEEDELSKAKFISVPKGTSMQTIGKLKLKNVVSYASANHPQSALDKGCKVPSSKLAQMFTTTTAAATTSATADGRIPDDEKLSTTSSQRTIESTSPNIFSMSWKYVQTRIWGQARPSSGQSSPRKTSTKVIPVQQYDHYLIPQDEEAGVSMHARSSRSAAGGNSTRSTGTSVRRNSQFSSIPQQGKGFILIEVEDHGIGISEEAMNELFSPFKQTQRLAGGTGLGLFSLAKRVEAMHGSYGVKKRQDGQKGSLFWFSFPYRPDMLLAKSHGDGYARERMHEINGGGKSSVNVDSNVDDKIISDSDQVPEKIVMLNRREKSIVPSLKDLNGSDSNKLPLDSKGGANLLQQSAKVKTSTNPETGSGSAGNNNSSQQKKLDILVAEDSPTISKMVKMMLSRHGHKVTIAENGEEVLKRVKERIQEKLPQFDVILMDMQMPVMDGLEATRRLRMLEEEQVTVPPEPPLMFKVIGLSANSDEETTQQAFDAGIDSFIPKPFDLASFMTVMQGLEE